MAIVSMTGFARADGSRAGWRWHWEVRSVNGKALDVRLRLPADFDDLEPPARDLVQARLRRGNVQVALQASRADAAPAVAVNQAALDAILAAATALRDRIGGPPLTVEGLLALRGVVEAVEPEDSEEAVTARNEDLLTSLAAALDDLAAMRRGEGGRLAAVLAGHVGRIEALTGEARASPARTPEAIRARLAEQVARIAGASPALDPQRLHQEAMLLAARSDIQEELDRLAAHAAAARDLLAAAEPVGRKLDFLAQEFNREANTVCSKSSDAGLTRIGLELKTVIDQFREQVQNVE